MTGENWWQSWGQGAVAVLALLLSIYNTLQARRKHRWEEADRERVDARRLWCEDEQRKLFDPNWHGRHPVTPDKPPWARWGKEQGYFDLQPGGQAGEWVLVRPSRSP